LPPARKLVAQHSFQALLLRRGIIAEAKNDGRRERSSEKRDGETNSWKKLYRHLGSRLR
jgi:hypothetical protein